MENIHGNQQCNAEVHQTDVLVIQAVPAQGSVKQDGGLPETEIPECPCHEREGLGQVLGPDEEPAEGQNQEGPQGLEQLPAQSVLVDVQGGPHLFVPGAQQNGGGDKEGLIAAVYHIVPAGAMPDAYQNENDHRGQGCGKHLFQVLIGNFLGELHDGPVEHNGVVQILLHEFSQGHMPPLPVFRDASGNQGRAEVFGQTDVQHFGKTHDHINAAGEVGVDLEAIEHHGPEQQKAPCGLVFQNGHDQNADPVCNDHLFEIAPQGALHPHDDPLALGLVGKLELGRGPFVEIDRALDDGGKVSDEEKIVQKIPLCLVLFVVDVVGVGNHGQGEIGQPNGGDQRIDADPLAAQKVLQEQEGVLEELEIAQNRQRQHDVQPENPAGLAFLL